MMTALKLINCGAIREPGVIVPLLRHLYETLHATSHTGEIAHLVFGAFCLSILQTFGDEVAHPVTEATAEFLTQMPSLLRIPMPRPVCIF
jgi:hypothetical protein